MSTRPRRSCTFLPIKPILLDVLERIENDNTNDTMIYNEFKNTCRYYIYDIEGLTKFWLKHTSEYDLTCRAHQQLLSRVFEALDLTHRRVVKYLTMMSREEVRACGLQRVVLSKKEGDSTVVYRPRTGMDTCSSSRYDYDDYYKAGSYHLEHTSM